VTTSSSLVGGAKQKGKKENETKGTRNNGSSHLTTSRAYDKFEEALLEVHHFCTLATWNAPWLILFQVILQLAA
jgi:hypothetical protein